MKKQTRVKAQEPSAIVTTQSKNTRYSSGVSYWLDCKPMPPELVAHELKLVRDDRDMWREIAMLLAGKKAQ